MNIVLIRPTTGARRATRRTALAAALLLASSTLAVSVPQQAGATTSCLAGGGIEGNPFLVATEADLRKVGSGVDGCTLSAHYLQTQHITLNGTFTSIGRGPDGSYAPFDGIYDGGGHTITGLDIDEAMFSNVGLFAHADDATLRNIHLLAPQVVGESAVGGLAGQLGDRDVSYNPLPGRGFVENVLISGGSIESKEWGVGGVVGQSYGSIRDAHFSGAVVAGDGGGYSAAGGIAGEGLGEIARSSASGTVTATGDSVGGLVGANYGGSIMNSWSTAEVQGANRVGGLVGDNSGGSIIASFSTSTVDGGQAVGGLIGDHYNGGTIADSYATGFVGGTNKVGGLIGANEADVTNAFAVGLVTGVTRVGGLIGDEDDGDVTASFWDVDTTGIVDDDSSAATGRTTAEMTSFATFDAAWNTASTVIVAGWQAPSNPTWGMCSGVNGGYPFLLWQFDADPCSTTTPTTAASTPVLIGGVAPEVPTGQGVWQQADGTSTPLAVSSTAANQLRYEAGGVRVTLAGTAASSPARGLVVDPAGEIACEVCVAASAGQVIEVWLFSTPRLVAAHRVDDTECHLFAIPMSAPLDGGGPVSAGAHTLQLAIPTSSGMQAINIGVTVGGLVPASVPAGEGGVPLPLGLLLAALVSLAGAALVGRRALAIR